MKDKDFKTRVSDVGDDIKDTFSIEGKPRSRQQVQTTVETDEPVTIKEGKKSSKEERLESVKQNSVCGSCLQTYDDMPREVKVSGKFEGEKVTGYQCPACATAEKPLQIVIAEVDGNEQGFVEVSVRNLEHRSKLKD